MQVRIGDCPQLKLIAWNRRPTDMLDGEEALALHERNWRYIEQDELQADERRLIEHLVAKYGHGVLHI